MTKKISITPYLRNRTSYDCGLRYNFVKWWYLQQFFSFFQNSDFLDFQGGGQGMTHNYQFQSITLYISRTVDHSSRFLVHRCKIMISSGVFLYFFGKCSIVNIKKFLHFLLAHFNSFLINSCFSSSSINTKQKFWGVPPPSSHVCDFLIL